MQQAVSTVSVDRAGGSGDGPEIGAYRRQARLGHWGLGGDGTRVPGKTLGFGGTCDVKRKMASGLYLPLPRAGRYARAASIAAVSCALATILGGCASNGDSPTAALPSIPALPKIKLPEAAPPVVGSATEVYERIGRGAMACWFGADGILKSTHIYEATAEPASKGGKAEILIRARDNSSASPRGVKAFQITITPTSEEETSVAAENLKLPEPMATNMKKSVAAWSIGEQGCDPDSFKGAWQAEPAEAAKAGESTKKQKATQLKK